jgi:hypothetical protein
MLQPPVQPSGSKTRNAIWKHHPLADFDAKIGCGRIRNHLENPVNQLVQHEHFGTSDFNDIVDRVARSHLSNGVRHITGSHRLDKDRWGAYGMAFGRYKRDGANEFKELRGGQQRVRDRRDLGNF